MSKRIAAAVGAAAISFGMALALSAPARAQGDVMKECGAEYQTAKSANTLAGKTWNQYLAECRVRHAQPTAAKPATPAPPAAAAPAAAPAKAAAPAVAPAAKPAAPTASAAPPAAKPSDGRQAMIARERACGAEWKAKKADLRKTNPGLKWPQYWSECNTRLKAAGQ